MSRKLIGAFILLGFILLTSIPAEASMQEYFSNLGRDYVRGFKNVISCPLEIPITIREYHGKEGYPVFLHIAGFVDGTFQMITRGGSGLWDFGAGVLPGDQDGYPPTPETLF
jgi:hypothetical protein